MNALSAAQIKKIATRLKISSTLTAAATDYFHGRKDDKGQRVTIWGLCCIHGIGDQNKLHDAIYNIDNNRHLVRG